MKECKVANEKKLGIENPEKMGTEMDQFEIVSLKPPSLF